LVKISPKRPFAAKIVALAWIYLDWLDWLGFLGKISLLKLNLSEK
jgi:hypothetical protein